MRPLAAPDERDHAANGGSPLSACDVNRTDRLRWSV